MIEGNEIQYIKLYLEGDKVHWDFNWNLVQLNL